MRRMGRRATVMVMLCCALSSGCWGYRAVTLPGASAAPQGDGAGLQPVAVGSTVRVTLSDGTRRSGEVVRADSESITLGTPGNYGLEEREIPAREIARIEVESASAEQQVLAGTVFALIALAVYGLSTIDMDMN